MMRKSIFLYLYILLLGIHTNTLFGMQKDVNEMTDKELNDEFIDLAIQQNEETQKRYEAILDEQQRRRELKIKRKSAQLKTENKEQKKLACELRIKEAEEKLQKIEEQAHKLATQTEKILQERFQKEEKVAPQRNIKDMTDEELQKEYATWENKLSLTEEENKRFQTLHNEQRERINKEIFQLGQRDDLTKEEKERYQALIDKHRHLVGPARTKEQKRLDQERLMEQLHAQKTNEEERRRASEEYRSHQKNAREKEENLKQSLKGLHGNLQTLASRLKR